MTVGELERLLSTLPDDTHVLIGGAHIEFISRRPVHVRPVVVGGHECGDCGQHWVREYEEREVPAYVDLDKTMYAKGIDKTPPIVDLVGRWPRKSREAMSR